MPHGTLNRPSFLGSLGVALPGSKQRPTAELLGRDCFSRSYWQLSAIWRSLGGAQPGLE